MNLQINDQNVSDKRRNQEGMALVAALVILVILGVISATVLIFATSETRVASSDLDRTQTFYAAEAKLEDMNFQFNNLFQSTVSPTAATLSTIGTNTTPAIRDLYTAQGFSFAGSSLEVDAVRRAQFVSIFGSTQPFLRIPDGPYFGMSASVEPYLGTATATQLSTGTKVTLTRQFNSYLIPIFQFSIFSDGDVELDPARLMSVSGRVHANKNVYAMRNLLFTGNITTAGELVRDVNRSGDPNNKSGNRTVEMAVLSPTSTCPLQVCRVPMNLSGGSGAFLGSVDNGPAWSGVVGPGYWPGSPAGSPSSDIIGGENWNTFSLKTPTANNQPARFNKQLLTNSNNQIEPLKLPLGFDDVTPVELIKRRLPTVDDRTANIALKEARYDGKAQIRILIDDEGITGTNDAGIPSGRGVNLSVFDPIPLCSSPCNPLRRVKDDGAYYSGTALNKVPIQHTNVSGTTTQTAATVRGVKAATTVVSGNTIPGGSGIRGRILIEVVPATCSTPPCAPVDVTTEILSMGMTVGEPNAIVRLQRPLWAAFVQDSRDRVNGTTNPTTLFDIQKETNNNGWESDGEISLLTSLLHFDLQLGFIKTPLTALNEDPTGGGRPIRRYGPPSLPAFADGDAVDAILAGAGIDLNPIVPINVYNVREGWVNDSQDPFYVYKRGITSVVDINMYNLRRWLDGRYDGNLLAGRTAVQGANIASNRGYVIYVSDRRGDQVRNEVVIPALGGGTLSTTNGNVDNEDVFYDPAQTVATPNGTDDGTPDIGEDVITNSVFRGYSGLLQKKTVELPDSAVQRETSWDILSPPLSTLTLGPRLLRALKVLSWDNSQTANNMFRRSVRLSFGESLATVCSSSTNGGITTWTCNADKLSSTKGITVATENMVYLAGNYNTNGIGNWVTGGSNLNNGKSESYRGVQVPASIICDAFFPLSKTWFDANSVMHPEGTSGGKTSNGDPYRIADHTTLSTQETAVRAAVMFGTTNSALKVSSGSPARTAAGIISSGGMHNAPRFLEQWNYGTDYTWSFSGSFVTLFNSTQAFAPWENSFSVTYTAPKRNWSFDSTFTDPNRLPPGTPFFQYVQSSGFNQVIEAK